MIGWRCPGRCAAGRRATVSRWAEPRSGPRVCRPGGRPAPHGAPRCPRPRRTTLRRPDFLRAIAPRHRPRSARAAVPPEPGRPRARPVRAGARRGAPAASGVGRCSARALAPTPARRSACPEPRPRRTARSVAAARGPRRPVPRARRLDRRNARGRSRDRPHNTA